MGYVRHNAIIATTQQKAAAKALANFARSVGAQALESTEVTNGYCTVCIPPDGSKEGWDESGKGDERRRVIKQWIADKKELYFEWVEVVYGDDDARADVVTDAWRHP